ncbi:DUF1841 family protein [Thiohalobacter sp. IOR34]|nr:DUF1841 family protein [Thiohalobacter sp. IOR34]WJW76798.1 DUF1841 family protein [Thiohalobacter sp. IOR34]
MFGTNRDQLRQVYCEVWRRHREGQPLAALDAQILEVILQHPEYHALLDDPEQALGRDFRPEDGQSNPFLHMGMHLAIREQLATDRPAGIGRRYRELLPDFADPHRLEHAMMECLGQILWEAQRSGRAPDDSRYLRCLDRLPRG